MALSVLAGCAAPGPQPPDATTIHATDRSVLMPAGRIVANIAGRGGSPSEAQSGHALELSFLKGSGSDTQNLGSTQVPIKFGGETFSGPRQLTHDFKLNWYELHYRWRKFLTEGAFGIEGLAGVALPRLDFRVSSSTQQASESFGAPGLSLGAGAIWRFRPATSVQGRLVYYTGSSDDINRATRAELYLVQGLGRNVAVRAGYVDWSLHVNRQDRANNSDINLQLSGPSIGLDVLF